MSSMNEAELEIPEWGDTAVTVDAALRRLSALRRRSDYHLGIGLRRAFLIEAHRVGGFGSFHEYAERLFDLNGRQAEERLRVALRLEELPSMSDALANGRLGWSAVRELTRVATEQNEQTWIDAARDRTVREVERMVSGRKLGELPDGPSRPEAEKHRVTVELSASTYALLQEARRALVRETGGSIDDEQLFAEMARRVLGEPAEGHSGYRIAITTCDRCKHATQQAGGESVTIDEAALEAASCDAQHVGRVHDPNAPTRATEQIPPRTRRAVLARHEHRCGVPGCRSSAFLHIHHIDLRSEGGDHDPQRLLPLCGTHHTLTHEGRLLIDGTWSAGFSFRHADARPYGSPHLDAPKAEAFAQVFSALCGM